MGRETKRFQLQPIGETLWHLWNTAYGVGTDSGDAGFIMKREDGYHAHARGDFAQLLGVHATLGAAQAQLEARY